MAMLNSIENRIAYLGIALAFAAGGCSSGPSRTEPPAIDADAAARQAIATYDTNGDGVISGKELDKCPAIKESLEHYDLKHDGKVTAEAIAARIREWQESKIGTTATKIGVVLDGQPLDGATINLEPEPFLGPRLATATGVTGRNGVVLMTIPTDPQNPQGERKSGVQCGLYKVRISKQAGGHETLPARYNSNTELGMEVAPRSEPRHFNLTSR